MRAALSFPIGLVPRMRDAQEVPRRRGGGTEDPALRYALAYALALGGAATLAFADFSVGEDGGTQAETRRLRRQLR